jgi:hypothetical protein
MVAGGVDLGMGIYALALILEARFASRAFGQLNGSPSCP